MNERIKSLAVTAKMLTEEELNQKISYNDKLEIFAEKFLEQVFKDIDQIARSRLFPDYDGNEHRVSHNNAILCVLSDIKREFDNE
jgi:hypothetical protein